tara:strand:+ start:90 stop:458 length:369 start_codon:yes stop_codon:yes gene_type:complete
MRYLLFDNPNEDYGVSFERAIVGVRSRGFGAFEDKVAQEVLDKFDSVKELTEEGFVRLKKKQVAGPTSFRLIPTIQQDATKVPGAVYAEESSTAPSEAAEVSLDDLVTVGEAVVENPLEGTQ